MHRHRHNPGMSTRERPLQPHQVEQLLYGKPITELRKENQMPDIKTALSTALEEGKRKFLTATITDWDEHEKEIRTQQPTQPQQEKAMFTATGHLSKDTFDFIKMHGGKFTGTQVEKEMEKLGYKAPSVGALITQFKRANTIARNAEDGTLIAVAPEYTPISGKYRKQVKAERRAAITAKRLATLAKNKAKAAKTAPVEQKAPVMDTITVSATNGIAALQAAPTALPVLPNLPTAESVLNNMSIIEARKLYDELKKLFS